MASLQQQLVRRLGAARAILLESRGTARHCAVSGVQKAAVQELLQDTMASQVLQSEEIAQISDRVMGIAWADGHVEELLSILANKAVPKRRKQQDFMAITSYGNEARWERLCNVDTSLNARADQFIRFAYDMGCVNPTEPTYKRWTASVLAAHFDEASAQALSMSSKLALYEYIKINHKRVVKHKPAVQTYILRLPTEPFELHQTQPELYERLFPAGQEPVKNKLNETLVMAIDNSFQCRGSSRKCPGTTMVPSVQQAPGDANANAATMLTNLLPMLIQNIANITNVRPGDEREPVISYGNARSGARRSFRALGDESFDAFRSSLPEMRYPPFASDTREGGDPSRGTRPPSRASSRHAPAAGLESRESLDHDSSRADEPRDADSDVGEPREAGVGADGDGEVVVPKRAPTPVKREPVETHPGDRILDAILARDAKAKQQISEERKKERAAAKQAKTEEKAAAASAAGKLAPAGKKAAAVAVACELPEKTPLKRPASAHALDVARPAQSRKCLPTTSPEDEGGSRVRATKPIVDHEKSRFQFLGRSGFKGPNPGNAKFVYGVPEGSKVTPQYASEAAARKAAQAWLKLELAAAGCGA